MNPTSPLLPGSLYQSLVAALGRACQTLLGQPCLARNDDAAPDVPAQPAVRLRTHLPEPAAGRLELLLEAAEARRLAALLAAGTEPAQEPSPEQLRDAARRLLEQIAAQLLPAGSPAPAIEETSAPFEASTARAIRLELAEGEPLRLWLQWDQALEAFLDASRQSRTETTSAQSMETDQTGEVEAGSNLELLLDVELEASIRFGQREMLLKDVLELRPGAVIELARQVDEPAELLVAGRVMARGEVVVIEGNYGLRITEILSPAERYQAIRSQTRS